MSQFALDKLLQQYNLAILETFDKECTGQFSTIFGLPCKHFIKKCLDEGSCISLDNIHVQWRVDIEVGMPLTQARYDCNEEMTSPRKKLIKSISDILYPCTSIEERAKITKKRGRPVGSKGGTGRDKSAFEYVDGRKCGKCKQSGHNARTCNQSPKAI